MRLDTSIFSDNMTGFLGDGDFNPSLKNICAGQIESSSRQQVWVTNPQIFEFTPQDAS